MKPFSFINVQLWTHTIPHSDSTYFQHVMLEKPRFTRWKIIKLPVAASNLKKIVFTTSHMHILFDINNFFLFNAKPFFKMNFCFFFVWDLRTICEQSFCTQHLSFAGVQSEFFVCVKLKDNILRLFIIYFHFSILLYIIIFRFSRKISFF